MILEKFSLAQKKGIVTGAAGGIGKGVSRGLAEAGATVVMADINVKQLEENAREISGNSNCKVLPLHLDITSQESIQVLVDKAVAELGKIDFLFNIAGAIFRAPTEEFPKEEWDRVLAVNLTGPFLLSQRVARHMIKNGIKGSIVHTSSMLSFFGGKTVPAYAASKGGLTQAGKTMCNDWGKYGIRVNAIAPGWVKTDLTKALQQNPGRFSEISARIPLGRWADPEDLAGPAIFLASDASAYVDGVVLPIDGGYMAM